jgi:DNA-binding protein HU-beta
MNKSELTSELANKLDISIEKAEKAIIAILEGIANTLTKGEAVSLSGFGNFGVKERSSRKVRNPRTGKEMMVAAKRVPFFKAGKKLKDLVDKK